MLTKTGQGGRDTFFELSEKELTLALKALNPEFVISYADGFVPNDIIVATPRRGAFRAATASSSPAPPPDAPHATGETKKQSPATSSTTPGSSTTSVREERKDASAAAGRVRVLHASYGAPPSACVDVTHAMREALAAGTGNIFTIDQLPPSQLGDPSPGVAKRLEVDYVDAAGTEHSVTVHELGLHWTDAWVLHYPTNSVDVPI